MDFETFRKDLNASIRDFGSNPEPTRADFLRKFPYLDAKEAEKLYNAFDMSRDITIQLVKQAIRERSLTEEDITYSIDELAAIEASVWPLLSAQYPYLEDANISSLIRYSCFYKMRVLETFEEKINAFIGDLGREFEKPGRIDFLRKFFYLDESEVLRLYNLRREIRGTAIQLVKQAMRGRSLTEEDIVHLSTALAAVESSVGPLLRARYPYLKDASISWLIHYAYSYKMILETFEEKINAFIGNLGSSAGMRQEDFLHALPYLDESEVRMLYKLREQIEDVAIQLFRQTMRERFLTEKDITYSIEARTAIKTSVESALKARYPYLKDDSLSIISGRAYFYVVY